MTPKPQVERAWGSIVGLGAAFGQAWDTLPCFLELCGTLGLHCGTHGLHLGTLGMHFGGILALWGRTLDRLGQLFKKNVKKVPKWSEKGNPNGVIFHEMCRLSRGICGTQKTLVF